MNSNPDDQDPGNPFASPQDTRIRASPPSTSTSTRYACDETCFGALGKGWGLAVDNALPMLGLLILYLILRIPSDYLDEISQSMGIRLPPWVFGLAFLYSIFVALPVSVGMDWVFVKAAREEPFSADDLFSAFSRNYWAVLGGVLLKWLVIGLGLLLFVLPGIYLMIRLLFVEYLLIDRKLGPIEAFHESWRMTTAREWTILFLGFMYVVIFLLGLMACFVGVLWAIIFLGCAFAIYYHTVCLNDRQEYNEIHPIADSDNPFSM